MIDSAHAISAFFFANQNEPNDSFPVVAVEPILTRESSGTNYAHHYSPLPSGFLDLPAVLVCDSEVGLFRRGAWIIL